MAYKARAEQYVSDRKRDYRLGNTNKTGKIGVVRL